MKGNSENVCGHENDNEQSNEEDYSAGNSKAMTTMKVTKRMEMMRATPICSPRPSESLVSVTTIIPDNKPTLLVNKSNKGNSLNSLCLSQS